MKTKKWIRCPYPGEKPGQGRWFECNTPWLNYLFTWTKLPKCQSSTEPEE